MRNMYKGNIELTYNEYKIIDKRLESNIIRIPTIKKESEIKAENNEIFYIYCTIEMSINGICLKLDLTSKNDTIEKLDSFQKNYSEIADFVGVKKISVEDKGGNDIDFFINIDKVYNRAYFIDNTEFYKNKLNILSWQMNTGDKFLLENEMYYRNFENKFDLLLVTYSILTNICILDGNIKELYLNKLYYAGIEIENNNSVVMDGYSYNNMDIKSYKYYIKKVRSVDYVFYKNMLLVYMLNLVYFIINKDLDKEKDKDYIADIGSHLTERYIELYDFN